MRRVIKANGSVLGFKYKNNVRKAKVCHGETVYGICVYGPCNDRTVNKKDRFFNELG